MIGRQIGPYKVVVKVGEGGMGQVYRATDSRLGRDVAVKVLHEEYAGDADRMARFRREAQLLASLNHPNIGAIYGFEESDEVHALVLEFVDGPTLADRIRSGPIPLDEVVAIARQIAEALAYAHDRGVIHRDLKPANIKLGLEGRVKVLDFGLAKALLDDSAGGTPLSLSDSPTLTRHMTPGLTGAHVLIGTAAYMSPEQARQRPTDRRADV